MNTLTIEYPSEILWALQEEPGEFEAEVKLLLALKLYETGRLSTGLAAQMAGVSRIAFFYELGKYGLSPFSETVDDLEEDLINARKASNFQ